MKIGLLTRDRNLVFDSHGTNISFTSAEKFEVGDIAGFGAVIIDARDREFAHRSMSEIRRDAEEDVYLKPLFMYEPDETKDVFISELADGEIDAGNISKAISRAESITAKKISLMEFKAKTFETEVALKVLRFYFTRNRTLQPVIIPTSKYGYIYPFVSVQFPMEDDFRAFEVLSFMERDGLLTGTFHDRIHLCSKCHSTFMNFREVCPKCRSSQLTQEDVIHHFLCGHTAPQKNFENGESLVCPKCGKILRHIGVDYDKPSRVYRCGSCGFVFQEPEVEVFCLYCGNKTPVEDSETRDIKSYVLTPAGNNCAVHGITFSISEFLRDKLKIVDYRFFTDLVNLEIERNKRYKRESSVGYLQINNFIQALNMSGERKSGILIEVARIIKDALRKTDIITAYNESTFLLLLLETAPQNSTIVLERVKKQLDELFRSNPLPVSSGIVPEVTTRVLPVKEGVSISALFE